MDTRLKIAGGEINVSSDEINLMPESTRDLFVKMISQFTGGEPCVVAGCKTVFGGPAPIIEEGYVFLNGKLLKVDQHTLLDFNSGTFDDFNPPAQFEETVISDPEGVRDFRDGNQNNVYLKERAVVRQVANVTGLQLIYIPFGASAGDFNGDTLTKFINPPVTLPVNYESLGVRHSFNAPDSRVEVDIDPNINPFFNTNNLEFRLLIKTTTSTELLIFNYGGQSPDGNNRINIPVNPSLSVQYYFLFEVINSDDDLRQL